MIKVVIYCISTTVAPPLPPVLTIETAGEPIEGELFSLWCNVTVLGSSAVRDNIVTVSWENPSGTIIKSTTTSTNLEIAFQHLSQDDEGSYTCTASVRLQSSAQLLTANSSVEVVMKSKPKRLNLSFNKMIVCYL